MRWKKEKGKGKKKMGRTEVRPLHLAVFGGLGERVEFSLGALSCFRAEECFADADGFGCDFDEFVVGDPFERGFECVAVWYVEADVHLSDGHADV